MPALPIAIVRHTPLWVWGLLFVLVRAGWRQTVVRDVTALRLLLLPAAIGALSLASAALAFGRTGPGGVLGAWITGAVLGFAAHGAVPPTPGSARANPDGSFRVEGSYAPLALMLFVFFARYANGIALAMHPALATQRAYALAASLAFALPAGVLASRSRRVFAVSAGVDAVAA